MNFLRRFICNEGGAVTVDWFVLTASVVGMAVLASALFSDVLAQAAVLVMTKVDDAIQVYHD